MEWLFFINLQINAFDLITTGNHTIFIKPDFNGLYQRFGVGKKIRRIDNGKMK